MNDFIKENFRVDGSVYERNLAHYANTMDNFKDFMISLDQKNWKDSISLNQ